MTFPIIIRLSTNHVDALAGCEHGSFEDMEAAEERGEDTLVRPIESHTYTVCRRQKMHLRIENPAEADDVYYAVCSGTFQLKHLKIAQRIADELRPHAKAETVRLWPRPTGL